MVKFIWTKSLNILFLLFCSTCLFAQQSEFAFLGGITNYLGDLQLKPFSMSNARGVMGLVYKYPLSSKFWLRGGASVGKIAAWDGNNSKNYLVERNLSFESKVTDGYVAAEFRFLREERSSIIPFAFAGLGYFSFNPYAYYGDKNEKVYLRPLGTEGQGLPEYPNREMYKLEQVMIPLGAGILWHASPRWTFGLELRGNVTFTDYLDDVSGQYALEAPLLQGRGQLAVDLAWRADEINNLPYPTSESLRGNPDKDDLYYHLAFFIGMKWPNFKDGSKNQVGCPRW